MSIVLGPWALGPGPWSLVLGRWSLFLGPRRNVGRALSGSPCAHLAHQMLFHSARSTLREVGEFDWGPWVLGNFRSAFWFKNPREVPIFPISKKTSIMTDAARVHRVRQRWPWHIIPTRCETPGCNRFPNPPHRHCCRLCYHSHGQRHRPRCESQDAQRRLDHVGTFIRSRSRSPRAKAIPRQAVDAPSAPTSQAVPSWGSMETRLPAASQAVDAPSASASTSTSIEPRETPAAASDEIPICPLCYQRLRLSSGASITLNCGHIYCTHCWQRCLQAAGTAGSLLRCPSCRQPVEHTTRMYGSYGGTS